MSDKPRQNPDLTPSVRKKLGMDADAIKKSFGIHMEYSLAKDEYTATPYDCYSSLALSTRDRLMESLHERFPQYGFDRHKGYGTAEHLAALKQYGPCPEHRRSFAPVRERQDELFR